MFVCARHAVGPVGPFAVQGVVFQCVCSLRSCVSMRSQSKELCFNVFAV